jgi:hypothetical protein
VRWRSGCFQPRSVWFPEFILNPITSKVLILIKKIKYKSKIYSRGEFIKPNKIISTCLL